MFSHRQYLFISIIFILTFSAVSFLYSPVAAQSPAEAQYKEDYNADGKVNVSDAIALLILQRNNPRRRSPGRLRADWRVFRADDTGDDLCPSDQRR